MADDLRTQLGQVEPRILEDEMRTSYMDYAMSVIVSRALPDVRDGLKPVHRRVLYAMHQMGLRSNAKFRKSAAVVGEVMAKYHPHGDVAIYDSLVRLAQPFNMRHPLVIGQGNFGSMDGDGAAAMRYTEAKMASISNEILADIEKNTVDFVPNYDGTINEPAWLPSRVPNLLINGTLGIAVGMATNIPPHNLGEIVSGTVHLIDNPEAGIEDLMQFIQGPDFPTGGTIYGINSIKSMYSPAGKGSIVIRAVAEVVEGAKKDFKIIITEMPYAVNKAALIARAAELVRDKKIQGISDIRDESDKDGVRVVIELKRDAFPKKVINQLYKLTALQSVFHANMVALVDGIQPRTLSLKNILEEFIEHRRRIIVRRSEFELARAKERAHILEGLKKALDNIDKVIAAIKKSKDRDAARVALMKGFKLSEIQANAILEMRLSALAALERKRIEDELKTVRDTIRGLEDLLKNPKKRDDIIKRELNEVKNNYGNERRTKIVKHEIGKFSEEDLIPNEDVIVTVTKGGYIKRTPVGVYRAQGRGGKGVVGMATKEEDVVEHLIFAKNHDFLLMFTNEGRVFQTKVYEVVAASRTAKGQAVQNVVQASPDEKVTSLIVIPDFNLEGHFLFMATKHGTVKKTPLKQFENVRKVGIRAIGLDKGDELKWVKPTSGKDDIIMATKMGQALRTHESEIRPMGRTARGVRGIKLRAGDELVGMDVVVPNSEMLVICQNGYGKRTELAQFDVHHRGGVGIRAARVTDKTGPVVDVRIITDVKGDIIVISKSGQIIRVKLLGISKIGRDTQGVRIMRMREGDKVASVASVEKEDEVSLEPPPQPELPVVKPKEKSTVLKSAKRTVLKTKPGKPKPKKKKK